MNISSSTHGSDIGVIGLAVMGSNLAQNIESRGFKVSVYNRTYKVTQDFLATLSGHNFDGREKLEDFVSSIKRPRSVIIMVKAGEGTDAVITSLLSLLEEGDIIIDGGNALYTDTVRREALCKSRGLNFLGVGISGGEEGALKGPSLMPGGPNQAYQIIKPMLEKIAARVNDEPCVTYIGPDGSGHFVKMVHNGIEYGDMQLIGESYDLLRKLSSATPVELEALFKSWNAGPLNSFLIEITATVFAKKDPQGKGYLIDNILDRGGQKGTGRWTIEEALKLGVPIPTIAAAVDARSLSARVEERQQISTTYSSFSGCSLTKYSVADLNKTLHDALYAAKIITYAQGMALLDEASRAFNWKLNLSQIAAIWRGGCIIRARFLETIRAAYAKDTTIKNLLVSPIIKNELAPCLSALRKAVALAADAGIPLAAHASALNYFESFAANSLPLNLTQAQRDLFGAHTYQRKDNPGVAIHSEWNE
jgi:6-phosphogluconate dehydrogenase